jgi:endoglucanase
VVAALKAFYFVRSRIDLEPEFAGVWARPGGHPDDQVRVHRSAESPTRPEGTLIASPGGWYDAGDYNKYIVNSSFTTASLFSAFEHFPEYYSRLEVGIPESADEVPDIIDEAVFNLR